MSKAKQALTETPLLCSPNPFENNLNVQFYVEGGDYTLELVGITGQVFYQENFQFAQGNQYLDINTRDIPDGYYFLRIVGEQTQGTQAVVKN